LKKHLPNLLTSVNVFFGALATVAVLGGRVADSVIFIAVSLAADFLDGLVARALKVSGPLGKELDSLADMVSFGMFPGALAYWLLRQTAWAHWAWVGFIITVFSAWRLAKFNLDTRQEQYFIGLPTPANTMFFLGMGAAYVREASFRQFLQAHVWALAAVIGVMSVLLVAEVPMLSLKIKFFSLRENWRIVVLVGGALLLLWWLPLSYFLFAVILWYLLWSLVAGR